MPACGQAGFWELLLFCIPHVVPNSWALSYPQATPETVTMPGSLDSAAGILLEGWWRARWPCFRFESRIAELGLEGRGLRAEGRCAHWGHRVLGEWFHVALTLLSSVASSQRMTSESFMAQGFAWPSGVPVTAPLPGILEGPLPGSKFPIKGAASTPRGRGLPG
jgi:hypothetical protein